MKAIKATWKNGRILPSEPVSWPEGSELMVEPMSNAIGKIGLEESEWRDDPEALADWDTWLGTIEPLLLSDDERATFERYDSESRRYNREAVRRQMALGEGP